MNLFVKDVNLFLKDHVILENINISMSGGNVYGFIGRNGSGKTMLLRVLSGLVLPSSGTIYLDGKELHRDFSILPNLGVVIENVGLYADLTGRQNLEYLAKFNRKIGLKEIDDSLIRVGLDPTDKRSYRKYSLGMKQRLAIAQAIMEKPDILMLDEPTNSLDVEGVDIIREIIVEERSRGAIVLLTSHNKEDIRLLADKIFQIKNKTIVSLEYLI